jgi:hypothetical protein
MEKLLKFSVGKNNSKLAKLEKLTGKKVYTFSTLSGVSCVGAQECLAKVVDTDGKRHIWNGPGQKFRCFSASLELAFPTVYSQRKHNMDLISGLKLKELTKLIDESIPEDAEIIRIFVGGDHQKQHHFDAWLAAIRNHSSRLFYSYTKSLPFWVARLDEIPDNYSLTASYGGRFDAQIEKHGLKSALVVGSQEEASDLGLDIDYTDEHACLPKYAGVSFALLIHNKMTPGTWGSVAMKKLNKAKKNEKRI